MARRLSDEESLNLVKLYRQHECLWDISRENYRNKEVRISALQDIAQQMALEGFGPDQVKYKIKTLRATYGLELDKIQKSLRSGSVYTPRMKWFKEMDAFIGNVTHKRLTTRHGEPVDDSCQKIWVSPDDELNENSNSDPFESEQDNFLIVLKPEPGDNIKQEASDQHKIKKRKFKHRSSTDNSDRSYRNSIENEAKEDEFDIYGKYIASQLRKMSLQKALRLQLEIQSLVSEARISDISEH